MTYDILASSPAGLHDDTILLCSQLQTEARCRLLELDMSRCLWSPLPSDMVSELCLHAEFRNSGARPEDYIRCAQIKYVRIRPLVRIRMEPRECYDLASLRPLAIPLQVTCAQNPSIAP